MIQNGQSPEAFRLASEVMIVISHSVPDLLRLAGSATNTLPSDVTPRRTMKCPCLVKCPGPMIATTSFPLESASISGCGLVRGEAVTFRPHACAAPVTTEWYDPLLLHQCPFSYAHCAMCGGSTVSDVRLETTIAMDVGPQP